MFRFTSVITATLLLTALPAQARQAAIGTPAELVTALATAKPGSTIELRPGVYDGAFFATASGTASAPITLSGPRTAVLKNTRKACDPNVPPERKAQGVSYCGYGLHLNQVKHWVLKGFSVADSAKGIVLDGSDNNVVDDVEVSRIGDEGVHFRADSNDNVVKNSSVHHVGIAQPAYGEGVYFGSAKGANWGKYGDRPGDQNTPDTSDRNQALDNRLGPNVAAEHVDIKEGTTGGKVLRNSFDGVGMTGQNSSESWVNAKGNDYEISDNKGVRSFEHGFKVIQRLPGWGCGNVFHRNVADVQAAGYGFQFPHNRKCAAKPNLVYRDNTVTNAAKGFSDVPPVG
ncbi:Right handed beta helix region [Allokutzneria albata]|uniref:Right handed beta helix region n=1 Tax=Allokutzneria albata TaxID=211114 RepID=A0A1G9V511_ALLAB|nr:Right handed beta helix region [Allokutzneria albata]